MTYTRNAQLRIEELERALAQKNAKLKQLEEEIKKYQTEKRDKTVRHDMASDGKIDLQNISPSMAKQIIKSFEQNYDERATSNIETLRHREGADNPDVIKYDLDKKTYDELKKRFNL